MMPRGLAVCETLKAYNHTMYNSVLCMRLGGDKPALSIQQMQSKSDAVDGRTCDCTCQQQSKSVIS